ncbi:MAG TPA: DUF2889 domain-containing protein [Mycobacteriales bacterium]|nr:DUF2889 domain-containing protein [Mycobacteriales bacterium]
MRRTSVVDIHRMPDGEPASEAAPFVLRGRARDVAREADGAVRYLGAARLGARIELTPAPAIVSIEASPEPAGLRDLVGVQATSGFRHALASAVPGEVDGCTRLHALLDDIPGAFVISGYISAASEPVRRSAGGYQPQADICSGWRTGGVMMSAMTNRGELPTLVGPAAPDIEQDRTGWDPAGDATPRSMRRRRRTDVRGEGEELRVDGFFRDSFIDADGAESVVHEYALQVVLDRGTLQVRSAEATPHVLPWVECPMAAASAADLVGDTLTDARPRVRRELRGIRSCTHLTDLLGSLADVPVLAGSLP